MIHELVKRKYFKLNNCCLLKFEIGEIQHVFNLEVQKEKKKQKEKQKEKDRRKLKKKGEKNERTEQKKEPNCFLVDLLLEGGRTESSKHPNHTHHNNHTKFTNYTNRNTNNRTTCRTS